jgi:hypothetical protein
VDVLYNEYIFGALATQLFDLVDLHLREVLCPAEMHKYYPLLCNHYERIRAIPGIAKYLNGPRRQAKVNGNDLG